MDETRALVSNSSSNQQEDSTGSRKVRKVPATEVQKAVATQEREREKRQRGTRNKKHREERVAEQDDDVGERRRNRQQHQHQRLPSTPSRILHPAAERSRAMAGSRSRKPAACFRP
jgi:hypothetical protein